MSTTHFLHNTQDYPLPVPQITRPDLDRTIVLPGKCAMAITEDEAALFNDANLSAGFEIRPMGDPAPWQDEADS